MAKVNAVEALRVTATILRTVDGSRARMHFELAEDLRQLLNGQLSLLAFQQKYDGADHPKIDPDHYMETSH